MPESITVDNFNIQNIKLPQKYKVCLYQHIQQEHLLLKSMQADLFQCSSCSESYDLELRIPKFLISCPHCLCLKCLKNIFIKHSPHQRQCPTCNLSFQSTFNAPEDFPTNPTLLQLLQSRPKTKHENFAEIDRKRALNGKRNNEQEHLFQDHHIRKKLKTEQEINSELGDLQELIMTQFTEMRKMLHNPVKIESEASSHGDNQKKITSDSTSAERYQDESRILIKEEHDDDRQSEASVTEITHKLKDIFTQAQEELNKYLKRNSRFVKSEIIHEEPMPSLPLEEIKTTLKTNTFNIFRNLDYGQVFTPSMVSIESEEEEEESSSPYEENQLDEKELEEMKNQILQRETKSQIKFDFSNKDISKEIFNSLCSEDFWNISHKNKVNHLEVDFSASSLTDKLFIDFIQKVLINLENLTSIVLNLAKTQISKDSIRVLSQQFLKYYKLTSFKLNCSRISIGDEAMKCIDDGLSWSVQTLENLEIILGSTDLRGEKFLDALMGMSQLKHLKLSFENSDISSEVVSSVVFCLHFLAQNLESLDLNFNGTDIADEGLESFSDHAVFQMNKLKHFKLSLGDTFVSEDFLLNFFQNLGSLATHLETLELDLHFTELYNTTFKQFCEEVLSEMISLRNLKLDLSQTKITEKSLKYFKIPVCSLESLTLNLSENKIHDLVLKSFKENINLKSIKDFNLQIAQTGVSDKALEEFFKSIKNGHHHVTNPPPLNKRSPVLPSDTKKHSNKEFKPKKKIKKNKESVPREFDPERKIYAELKKAIIHHEGRKQDPARMSTHRAARLIKGLEPKVYDDILIKILTRVLSLSTVGDTELEEWKTRLQVRMSSRMEMNSQNPKRKYQKRQSKSDSKKRNVEKSQSQISTEAKQDNHKKVRTERKRNIQRNHIEEKQSHGHTQKNHNHVSEISNKNDPIENIIV